MKKILIILMLTTTLIFSSCSIKNLSRICDENEAPSYLCDIANKHGVELEDIGNKIIVANITAINEGYYDVEDALRVTIGVLEILENPISYLYFKAHLEAIFTKYPEMLYVVRVYIEDFVNPRIMSNKDRMILQRFFGARIAGLEILRK